MNIALLILRVTGAVVLWPHGAQKALGLFGGYGFSGTVAGMSHMGIPVVLVYLVIAVGIAIDMAVAAYTVHLPNGFFMNFAGNQKGEGIEFFIYAVGISLALVIAGSGRIALLPKT